MDTVADDPQLARMAADFDHVSDEFRDRRLDFYRYVHAKKIGVVRSTKSGGFWYVPSYELAIHVQRHPEFFSNHNFSIPPRPVPPLIPATRDPPEHMEYKQMLTKLFTPRRAMALANKCRDLAAKFIKAGIAKGRLDVVQEVMFPLMAELTFGNILGMDVSKAFAYAEPVHHMTQRDYPHDKAAAEMAWLGDQITSEIRDRKIDPAGILGELSRVDFGGRALTEQELQLIAINLLIGGMGTTAFFMGSVSVFLGRNPGHRRQLLDEPTLIPGAIDELMRIYTPTQNFGRSIAQDTELGGQQIRKGDKLLIGYGAANFDPAVFENPQVADFRRKATLHMSFGIGAHRCLGSHIAKQVASTVAETLLELVPDYGLIESDLGQNGAMASMFGYHRVPIIAKAA